VEHLDAGHATTVPGVAEPTVRRRVRAHGRVQGVFFREGVRRDAQARGVAGWVSNEPDGTVAAVFEGPRAAVEALVELCRRGPGHAEVERLGVAEEEPQGERGFQVR
jgi:acylphosphatase